MERFTEDVPKLKGVLGKTVCIDHHEDDGASFDLKFVVQGHISCAEIVGQLLYSDSDYKDKKISNTILSGVLADSGTFRFVQPQHTSVLGYVEMVMNQSKIVLQRLNAEFGRLTQDEFAVVQHIMGNVELSKA